jgi:beta-N-acetylhexosaminidase
MEDEILHKLEHAVEDKVFPGAVVGVVRTNGEKLVLPMGNFTYDTNSPKVKDYTSYDVASITKSVPTASVALKLVEEGRLELDKKVADYLPELHTSHKEEMLIRHLLTYSVAGKFPTPGFSFQTATAASMWKGFYSIELKFPPGSAMQYSNYPMILLTKVLERIAGKTIDRLGSEYFFEPLEMQSATFFPKDKNTVPPTEVDDWRGLMQGVVHDETAFILERDGEITGCAGLFINAPDLLTFIEMLLNNGVHASKKYFKPETITAMCTNQLQSAGASMGLGWELNDPLFMGRFATATTFGKTGFTGTSCVIDIKRGIGLVLLSNRTYPKRGTTDGIRSLRRDIADIVFKP